MSLTQWVLWAIVLVIQNFAFTFVSRARNSGSLKRHLIAAIASNGVWFTNQILIFTQLFKLMTGEKGMPFALATGAYYMVFTVLGSITAHYWSLRNEKGKAAVGANEHYAQIPVAEWLRVKGAILNAEVHL